MIGRQIERCGERQIELHFLTTDRAFTARRLVRFGIDAVQDAVLRREVRVQHGG